MRRSLAVLISCMLMTGAFAGCSSEESSSSETVAASTTAVSTTAAETTAASESTTAAETETASASETVTTAEKTTSKPVTTEATTEETKPAELSGGDITGAWVTYENKTKLVMRFAEDGKFQQYTEITNLMEFSLDKANLNDQLELDVAFDGVTLTATYKGEEKIVMERVTGEASPDVLDGRYKVTGGDMTESLVGAAGSEVFIILDEGRTYASTGEIYTYSTEGNKLTINIQLVDGSTSSVESTYGVEGDELTIVSADGQAQVLGRMD